MYAMEKVIYCISGLGVDEKVFDNLKLHGLPLQYIPWLQPEKKESMQAYASRMARHINDPSPVLLGVSFGGMMGIEIAKQLAVQKLFIVSSIKSDEEMPKWMRVAGKIKLNKVLPSKPPYKLTERIDNHRLGVSNEQEKLMVRAYRKNADPVYLDWAIDKVLNWKNDWQPEKLVHIHGDKDRIFPIKKLNPTHVVPEGTHMIVYNRAKEVAAFIKSEMQ